MNSQVNAAARISRELAEYLGKDPASVKPDHSLRDDLGLDSMATIELLFRIEETFDIQIPDEDLPKLITVGDVTLYVQQKIAPPSAAKTAKTKSGSRQPKRRTNPQ